MHLFKFPRIGINLCSFALGKDKKGNFQSHNFDLVVLEYRDVTS